jgi:hypothetical protein
VVPSSPQENQTLAEVPVQIQCQKCTQFLVGSAMALGNSARPATRETGLAAREKFSYVLFCPRCAIIGMVTWEESSGPKRSPPSERVLVQVSPGFHAEVGRTQAGETLIVCDSCDTIQPD